MLKISLLGKTRIEYLGENLEPKLSNKLVAMIYLLIASKGRYLSKEKLMLYLWPESAEDAARYNLRYNLWILKKALPETPDGQSLVISDKDGCILNENYPLECDLLTIKELNLQHAGIDELVYAKNLFGGNIMEGWYLKNCSEFNEFILFDRMTCESRRMEILSALASKYETAGEFGKALEVLREQAAVEPENEELALHIMKMYAASGNRIAAISYYKTFESTLWNSLKIAPDEAITQYYKSLHSSGSAGLGQAAGISQAMSVIGTAGIAGMQADEKPAEALSVSGYCIGGVEYFLLSDILSKLLKKVNSSLLLQMDQTMAEDLGYIHREFLSVYEKAGGTAGKTTESVPTVRIILAFSRFMEIAASHYQVEVKIKNYQEIDPISAKVIEYMQDLDMENLKIQIV